MPQDLWRLQPFSRQFGADRGTPIDRYYIENFLALRAADIRGRVLEMGDNQYTRRFGGRRVARSDVLFQREGKPGVTIVDDLQTGRKLPVDAFDCVIFTQTLQLLYDLRGAIGNLHRMLKPGGVLLATFPGISQIVKDEKEGWFDHWRLTLIAARKLFGEPFGEANVLVEAKGNVLAAVAFLQGLAVHELSRAELEHRDPDYEMSITLRAVKAAAAPIARSA